MSMYVGTLSTYLHMNKAPAQILSGPILRVCVGEEGSIPPTGFQAVVLATVKGEQPSDSQDGVVSCKPVR